MSFPYSVFKTYVTGEVLTASDLNSTDVNHVNHQIPEDTDDYSVNVAEMQSVVDPYPASSESLPTALAGELERIRYQIKEITGETHWYHDVDRTIASLATLLGTSTTQIKAPDGSAALPSYTFSTGKSGLYHLGSEDIGLVSNETLALAITQSSGEIQVRTGFIFDTIDSGSAAAPIITQTGDINKGIYWGTDIVGIATDGLAAIVADAIGSVTQPRQPSFLVTAPANTVNVTGDGTSHTIEFDTEVYDLNADFNTGTYTFTAPVTGKYLLSVHCRVGGLTTGFTDGNLALITSNRTYYNTDNQSGALHNRAFAVTVIADMDAADTAHCVVVMAGGSKTAELSNSAEVNYFSGSLIN